MKAIAIFELANAIFIGFELIGQLNSRDKTKAARWLRIALLIFMIHLSADAMAYTLAGPSYPFALRYTVNLLAYSLSGVDMLVFIIYCKVFISAKAKVKRITFLIPMIAAGMCTLAGVVLFVAGKLIVYENGIAVEVNDIPIWLRLFEILVLLYMPAVILYHRKEIGWKATLLLELYSLTPIIAGIVAMFMETDFTIIMGAFDVLLVSTVVQAEEQREQLRRAFEKEKESNRIIGALSEDYTVINYVELTADENDDVGISYRTSDDFKRLVPNADDLGFTARILALKDTAVYEPDREQFYRDTRRSVVIEALSHSDTYTLYPRLHVNGQIVYYEMKFSATREGGNITAVVAGLRSIDEEKRKELAQKKLLEEKQEQLTESLAFTNFFLDTYVSAYYVNLNDFTYQVYKRPREQDEQYPVIGNYFESLQAYIDREVHPDDRAGLIAVFAPEKLRSILKEVPEYAHFFRTVSHNGERTVRVQIIRGADEDHAAIGFIDATEELKEQQKHLLGTMPLSNDVLNKANIGLWAFELDEGHPPRMYDDETMLGLVGLDHQVPPEEAYHAWYDHIDEGSYDLVNDAVAKMMDGEHAEVQYPWHYPDGRTIIVRCGGVRNFGYTKGIRIEGTHQNVTETLHFDEEERKREQQQKNDEIARAKAEAADKAKTEFLFNMSHDIRTPMNAILGYTDIALNHIDEQERVNDSLKKIKTSGGHLLRLINDILEMSRIEAGRMEIVNAPVNVYEVSESIINMSQALASTKDITFNADIRDLKNPYIYADELHTNQVIINLISNAIKYTRPGGTVTYCIGQTGDPVDGIANYRVTVKDNGIGMSEEFQKHLFESFAREQSTTVSRQEGAGLGLAIVKRIVDLTGGTVSVRSKQGEGSVFTVEFPLKVMDDAAIQAFEASRHADTDVQKDISLEGKRVLLVEDNEMNREIATEILEETGLTVESAEDGALAVKKVSARGASYYDFILMDIQMPVMNGYEATTRIRKLPGGDKVPIIALSANAFREDVDKSLAAGMNEHVAKPINVKELFECLKRYMA